MSSSWHWGTDTLNSIVKPIKDAVNCIKNSALLVFSAWNTHLFENWVGFPANMSGVLAVGAIDKFNELADYSPTYSRGDSLDLVAHSDCCFYGRGDIWSIDIMGTRGRNPSCADSIQVLNINYLNDFGGTSAAAPAVAGVAALLMSYDRKINYKPDLTVSQIREVLKKSAEDTIGNPDYDGIGWDRFYGYGRVNPMRALVAIGRGDINKDGRIALTDIIWLVNYVFDKDRPATGCLGTDPGNRWTPTPHKGLADTNCDGVISLVDVNYLVNFYYQKPGSAPPPICYEYDY